MYNMKYCNLNEILLNSATDKNTTHKYGNVYDLVFNTQFFKLNRPLKILEIGVSYFGDGSAKSISNVNYVGKYVGIDTTEYRGMVGDNVKLYTGPKYDAYTLNTIEFIKQNEGKFDIIIDDGPHTWESQKWFFENYYDLLNEGGVLFCEDIHESNYNNLKELTKKLNLYVLDLRLNSNINRDEIIALRYKDGINQTDVKNSIYDLNIKNTNNIKEVENVLHINFIKGAFAEIRGSREAEYTVKFINQLNGKTEYETTIKNNMWCRCSIEYFVNWRIEVYENGVLWKVHTYNANDKRVYIAFDSKALGDTLAWIPYIDEFRKKHKCEVICSTFMNERFVKEYPQIEFVNPGNGVNDLYAMYSFGLFYKEDNTFNSFKNPFDPKHQPMQKMATDILGLEYNEIRPKITHNPVQKEKQVTIAIHGTAQSKYWNNSNGWQEVVDWLNLKGYKVKLVSREGDGYMGNLHPKGIEQLPNGPIENVMDEMLKSEVFIGIGSGLSWLAWGLGVKTVLISGFSYDWAEMRDCIRISAPEGKCEGCFNRIKLDAGDWNWCPDHKGTERQFECTKSIQPYMVIEELEKIL
jgi:autotransporter strand-loop-strand O-heptosyltransferase